MATRHLATWAASLTFSDLPESVVKAAVRSFQNSLGCIVGGSQHPTVARAARAIRESGTRIDNGQGDRRLTSDLQEGKIAFFTSESTSNAALLAGIASHVHDYDDTHLRTVIHPAGAIIASLLAYSMQLKSTNQRRISGKEFITALVVGIETSLRLGNSISPSHYSAGWHITGTVSPLGVAAALSNLLKLDVDVTLAALGIASTQPVGIRVHFGTDTKALHAGRAAQVGLEAVRLAQAGFTAAPDALEGKRGWVEVLGHGANSLDEQIEELLALTELARKVPGTPEVSHTPWEIEKNTFKPFPCGIVIHPIIDACIQVRNKHGLADIDKLEAIDSVNLRVNPLVIDLTGKKSPKDGLQAKFSVYHGAAIGLLFGCATPGEYDDRLVVDLKVVKIREKVIAEADETVRSDESFLHIKVKDGNNIDMHVEHAVGSLERPMTNTELQQKFLDQVEPVTGRAKATYIDRFAWGVCDLEDVGCIVEAMER